MKPETDMPENTVQIDVQVTPKDKLTPTQQSDLLEFFRVGYGERWLGDGNFQKVMLANSTEVLQLLSNRQIAAALLFDNDRISDISVSPDFRGQGLGRKLFLEAAKARPNAWVTVGVDAAEMMRTVSSSSLNYLPVEQKSKIEKLFKQTNRGKTSYQVATGKAAVPILNKPVTTFARLGATHGTLYRQILFQNQPKED